MANDNRGEFETGHPSNQPLNNLVSNDSTALPVRFTGTGSEYFRIWIVNLLLSLATFTLYVPFARARRMAYFQNNTLVGEDPLGFHADPWKMFRGYLVVLVLGLAYWSVTRFFPDFGWMALLVFMALWPLLWRASLQFRLRNTSWRGVRFSFQGNAAGAYVAMLPFFVPLLVVTLVMPMDPDNAELILEEAQVMGASIGLVFLVFALLAPWLWKRLKAYQHGGYVFAQERTDFTATTGQFYKLFLKTLGWTLLTAVISGVLVAVGALVFAGIGLDSWVDSVSGEPDTMVIVIVALMMMVFYVLIPLLVGSYMGSRMQNLVWCNTRSSHLRFHSALRMPPLLWVTFVNWMLIAFTLGLFWPFAKVRMARLKLEAITVQVDGEVNDWIAQASAQDKGAMGDAAGDFFGLDVGL